MSGLLEAFALFLHLRPDRRLIQLQPDVDGEDEQEQRHEEGNAPTPLGKGLRVEQEEPASTDDEQRKEKSERRCRLDPARRIAAFARLGMLGNVGGGTAVFSSERQALQQAQGHQQNRCGPADAGHLSDDGQRLCAVGRQQADGEGRQAHHEDRDEEGILASHEIADAPEDDSAEGTNEEASRVGRKGREQRSGVVARWEEERREEWSQRRVEIKVIPFENGANGRGENHAPFFFCDSLARVAGRR